MKGPMSKYYHFCIEVRDEIMKFVNLQTQAYSAIQLIPARSCYFANMENYLIESST